jgi:hypothetical protein
VTPALLSSSKLATPMDRHTTAVLAKIFFLEWLKPAERFELRQQSFVLLAPFWRRQL